MIMKKEKIQERIGWFLEIGGWQFLGRRPFLNIYGLSSVL